MYIILVKSTDIWNYVYYLKFLHIRLDSQQISTVLGYKNRCRWNFQVSRWIVYAVPRLFRCHPRAGKFHPYRLLVIVSFFSISILKIIRNVKRHTCPFPGPWLTLLGMINSFQKHERKPFWYSRSLWSWPLAYWPPPNQPMANHLVKYENYMIIFFKKMSRKLFDQSTCEIWRLCNKYKYKCIKKLAIWPFKDTAEQSKAGDIRNSFYKF